MNEMLPELALMGELARKAPGGSLGRTALMKLLYLLQTIRGVPLPYRFTLYSYGPFDKDVLFDLGLAESMGLVTEEVVPYPSGYGYAIGAGDRTEVTAEAAAFLEAHRADIEWVLREFGGRTAAELELASTAVYADREAQAEGRAETVLGLAETVRDIKPKFPLGEVQAVVEELRGKRLLESVAS